MTISDDARARVKHAFEPIALAMGRAGLTPDALTLIGFGITVGGAALLSQQLWLLGGLVVFLGGAFDMFDGTLARATGKVSRLGAFMDSVFDRWGEASVYLGLIAGLVWADQSTTAILGAAAMGAAFMVSYARAKSEGLGFTAGTGMAAVGIMPREVRLVILSIGLVGTGLLELASGCQAPLLCLDTGPYLALTIALAIIAVGATITVIQRILHVRRQAKHQSTQTQ